MGAPDITVPPIPSQEESVSDPEVWDVIVVGAGVAGSALAFAQARQGRRVLLIERDLSQPDRIVGELLQPGGYLQLQKLGMGAAVSGIDAQSVVGYCLMKDGDQAVLPYPVEGYPIGTAGRSFHHGRFVQRLRTLCAAEESICMRQGTVKHLLAGGNEWKEAPHERVTGVAYKSAASGKQHLAHAHLTVVCDGMFSSLRKHLAVKAPVEHPSFFVGVILKGAKLPKPHHGHVVLARPSPILFYPISSDEVRCLVDVPGAKLPSAHTGELDAYLRGTVAPEIPTALRGAFLEALDAGGVRSMQNKSMSATPLHQPGALLLGDAFNMRHPLTGGGMTVALSDTTLLCDLLEPLPSYTNTAATANQTAAFYTARKPWAATINTLANALYKVFCCTGQPAHEEMRDACFHYLRQGGSAAEGPVSLLSGLNPKPSVLVGHFFSVALFGVGRLMSRRPSLPGLMAAISLLWVAIKIITPIVWNEGLTAIFAPLLVRKPKAVISSTGSVHKTMSWGNLR